jgi:hypothetical protein
MTLVNDVFCRPTRHQHASGTLCSVIARRQIQEPKTDMFVLFNQEIIMPTERKWSAEVTEHSDALALEENIFESDDPRKIARSLKRSAEASNKRKSEPYRSAMSMLTFYINRAGKNLPAEKKYVLEEAKDELRKAFGRES